MEQHAEAIDQRIAAPPGGDQQRRLERRIDDIGDQGLGRQGREIEIERRLAGHAQARRVDQQDGPGEDLAPRHPGLHRNPRAVHDGQGLGPIRRAVDEADFGRAGLEQPVADRPRRTARADDSGGTGCRRPGGRAVAQVFHETEGIRIVAGKAAVVSDHHRIDRADGPGRRAQACHQAEGGCLVGNRQIDPGEAAGGEAREVCGEVFGRNGEGIVGAVDTMAREPIAVQPGRQRMLHRPAHDACPDHWPTTPCPRR